MYAVYRDAVRSLADSSVETPEFDAQQLVQYCFGYNKTGLLMHSGAEVDEVKLLHYDDCVKRRCNHKPLQYVIGMWDFYKYSFKVGKGVLIPRPETELLVEFAIDKIQKNRYETIFDLCCGSGCIGLSIAKACPQVKGYCMDNSDDALSYTRQNKELLDIDNVTIIKGDVLSGTSFIDLPRPDLILSNPPYIRTNEIASLQPEIAYEPSLALDGGEDGLVFYRALAEIWYPLINRGGYIAMETGEDQASDILSLYVDKAEKGRVIKDAAGLDRVVVLVR